MPTTEHRRFVYVAPKAGDLLLWESWLRHEVPANGAASARISVSFNYRQRLILDPPGGCPAVTA